MPVPNALQPTGDKLPRSPGPGVGEALAAIATGELRENLAESDANYELARVCDAEYFAGESTSFRRIVAAHWEQVRAAIHSFTVPREMDFTRAQNDFRREASAMLRGSRPRASVPRMMWIPPASGIPDNVRLSDSTLSEV